MQILRDFSKEYSLFTAIIAFFVIGFFEITVRPTCLKGSYM